MKEEMTLKVIARIQSSFSEKFGIPRQSGRVPEICSRIVFEPEYRNAEALRGLEGFSHLWILWQFSEIEINGWFPTVRPPRLGGNQRMGVFATRSPYRPNPIGLSCVEIKDIEPASPQGPYIDVLGADLLDGTPIYDLKPYLPSVDGIAHAKGGFSDSVKDHHLTVSDPADLFDSVSDQTAALIRAVLSEDPRPGYQSDPQRIYSFECGGFHIEFRVEDRQAILCRLRPISCDVECVEEVNLP
ncbi:MAG: tRNA (N6-threonylcarbamoyladenosine(37)-N6)-methyltransferase TrmO [Clostridia bacterium]|nr:tRNA (N6-threonylcarbamoyladenosine(37)-N6)-methyltransferase TrmO [Clostridia bacterium]